VLEPVLKRRRERVRVYFLPHPPDPRCPAISAAALAPPTVSLGGLPQPSRKARPHLCPGLLVRRVAVTHREGSGFRWEADAPSCTHTPCTTTLHSYLSPLSHHPTAASAPSSSAADLPTLSPHLDSVCDRVPLGEEDDVPRRAGCIRWWDGS
jgi:hypothetical protein